MENLFISNLFEQELNQTLEQHINEYKQNIDMLDDCIFVDVLDELSSYNIDLKQFDELLNKNNLTDSERIYVEYLIGFTNSLIRQHIINKIEKLIEAYNKF